MLCLKLKKSRTKDDHEDDYDGRRESRIEGQAK